MKKMNFVQAKLGKLLKTNDMGQICTIIVLVLILIVMIFLVIYTWLFASYPQTKKWSLPPHQHFYPAAFRPFYLNWSQIHHFDWLTVDLNKGSLWLLGPVHIDRERSAALSHLPRSRNDSLHSHVHFASKSNELYIAITWRLWLPAVVDMPVSNWIGLPDILNPTHIWSRVETYESTIPTLQFNFFQPIWHKLSLNTSCTAWHWTLTTIRCASQFIGRSSLVKWTDWGVQLLQRSEYIVAAN